MVHWNNMGIKNSNVASTTCPWGIAHSILSFFFFTSSFCSVRREIYTFTQIIFFKGNEIFSERVADKRFRGWSDIYSVYLNFYFFYRTWKNVTLRGFIIFLHVIISKKIFFWYSRPPSLVRNTIFFI